MIENFVIIWDDWRFFLKEIVWTWEQSVPVLRINLSLELSLSWLSSWIKTLIQVSRDDLRQLVEARTVPPAALTLQAILQEELDIVDERDENVDNVYSVNTIDVVEEDDEEVEGATAADETGPLSGNLSLFAILSFVCPYTNW